ncbi:MAG TPA: hypothetical protein ENJ54_06425 [Chloroflexi bacterium]|nr:hypothetical protein [Chloroflexota bacterium]
MNELPAGEAQPKPAAEQAQEGSFAELIRKALEDTRREQREVALMLEQSQAEVSRLGQKSASVVAYVKQMRERKQWEDLASACESALDAQQRYLIMRGQLEKLQQVYEALGRFEETLLALQKASEQQPSARPGGNENSLAVLEMLVQAQEAERQRLSRQMHDGPAQALSNFILQTEIASRLFEVDPDSARQELQALKTAAAHTFQQVREFIFELRPMMLDDLGLVPTVKRYLETLSKQGEAQIEVRIFGEERRYAGYLEVFVFRTIQELVSTAIHNRKATRVAVRLDLDERQVKVEMTDNGDLLEVDTEGPNAPMGLRLLRERVEMLGGTMTVSNDDGENRIVFEVLAPQVN